MSCFGLSVPGGGVPGGGSFTLMPGSGEKVVAIMKKINSRKTQSISGVMVNCNSDFRLLPGAVSSPLKMVTPSLVN